LIETLQAHGAKHGLQVTLHVEPNNPAQRLYQRLGFTLIEQRGVYDFLGWSAPL
jgi:ribosomal protein S18 acetylase RimI-like enzyme